MLLRILILLAFFCSGLTSLIFETLWMRMLVLVFGGTTLAIVTILTAFMGGLALGSAVAGRLSDRIQRPLWVYGGLELGVALYALLSPHLIRALPHLYQWVPLDWPFWATALIRFVFCVLLLLLPTVLMGATLPVLSLMFASRREEIGFDVGILYSVNTAGAVFGALVGGFVFLPLWGHQATLKGCVGLLFVVAGMMLYLGSRPGNHELARSEAQDDEVSLAEFAEESSPAQRQAALLSLGLTGAVAMVCQVVWSRALAMVIGSSTYAFTLILGLFLIGLALGAAWGSWLVRRSMDLYASWSGLLVAAGFAVGIGCLFIDQLPLLFLALVYDSVGKISVAGLFLLKAALAALPILAPTFLMGTFFPLALGVYTQDEGAVGQHVGKLYAANTLGSILGSVATGFVLIPLIGLQKSLALCVALYCGLGLYFTFLLKAERRTALSILAALGCVAIWLAPSWHPGRLSLGMFRLSLMNTYTYKTAATPAHVLYYKEGISATVTVQGGEVHRGLKVNGKADASSISDSATQVASAALPLVLHPKAHKVMVIGWGSGMTAGAALHFPLRSLWAVEIEPAVVEGARLFAKWNFRPHRDKRLRLFYNDGRNILTMSSRRYDVISSEPSNPWMSGTANLFTKEFFEIAKKRLEPKGMHCQFIQLYELSYQNILTLLRSARVVFPYIRLFSPEPNNWDTLLVASKHPISMDLGTLLKRMSDPRYGELWKRMKLKDAYGLLPRLMMGEKEIDALLAETSVPLNTDDHNRIEFTAPYDLVRHSSSKAASKFQRKAEGFGLRFRHYVSWRGRPLAQSRSADVWRRTMLAFLRFGKVEQAKKLLPFLKRAGASPTTFARMQRLVRMMNSDEKAPVAPKLRDIERRYRKWMPLLYKARIAFFQDRESKCVELVKKLEKQADFVKAFPSVWFIHAMCARHLRQHHVALRYYRHYLRQTAARQSPTKDTIPPKRNATSQPTSRPTSRPTQPTRPASQPARKPQ